jgi:hypothetical protein
VRSFGCQNRNSRSTGGGERDAAPENYVADEQPMRALKSQVELGRGDEAEETG